MDKRTLIILAGLLFPIIALALLAQSEPPAKPAPVAAIAVPQVTAPPAASPLPSVQTLEDARARARVILDRLNNMTPEEWDAEQKRRAGIAPASEPPKELILLPEKDGEN